MKPSVKVISTSQLLYLRPKKVEGFNEKVHCAIYLKGDYAKTFSLKMPQGETVTLPYEDGDILYFCSVAKPHNWNNNKHLTGEVEAGHPAVTLELHTGHKMTEANIRSIEIKVETPNGFKRISRNHTPLAETSSSSSNTFQTTNKIDILYIYPLKAYFTVGATFYEMLWSCISIDSIPIIWQYLY